MPRTQEQTRYQQRWATDQDPGLGAPESLPAEQLVIGGALCSQAFRAWAVANVVAQDFYRHAHQDIWAAFLGCDTDVGSAHQELVTAKLAAAGRLESCGGREYLRAVAQQAWPSRNDFQALVIAANDLRGLATSRNLLLMTADIRERIERTPEDSVDHLRFATQELDRLSGAAAFGFGAKPAAELVDDFAAQMQERRQQPFRISGPRTGIEELDQVIGGFVDERLVILQGMSGFGKTMLGGQIAWQTDLDNHDGTMGVFPCYIAEGPQDAFLRRWVAWLSGVATRNLRTGGGAISTEDDEHRIKWATERMRRSCLRVTQYARTIDQIETDIRRIASQERIAGVMIDHAQKIGEASGGDRVTTLELVASRLQSVADDIRAPVFLLSQVTKDISGDVSAKWAKGITENASLALTINRGEDGQSVDDRRKSEDMWISASKTREGEPLDLVHVTVDGPRFRLYGDAAYARLRSAAR